MTTQGGLTDYFNPNDSNIKDLAYDGTYLWAVNTDGVLKKFDVHSKKSAADGTLVDSIVGLLTGGWGLTFDGEFLWASDPDKDRIYQILITTTSTYSISGYVKDQTDAGIQNVAVTLSSNTRTTVYTNSAGYYELTNLTEGDYTVTPNKDRWAFEPSQMSYTPLNSDQSNQNYVGIKEEIILELEPDATSVVQGGTLGYQVSVTNNMSDSKTFYYYTNVTLPNSSTYPSSPNWLFSYGPVTVPSGETRNAHLVHNVPNVAPIGSYTYNAFIGLPDDIWDEDHFDFTVSAAKNFTIPDYETDWNVIENGLNRNDVKVIMSTNEGLHLQPGFSLHQNYPNPINGLTNISYSLAINSHVKLEIYDVTGQLVKTLVDQRQESGFYKIMWNGEDNTSKELTSGIYFYRLQAGTYSDMKKMTFIR